MNRRIAICLALISFGGFVECFRVSSAPATEVFSYDTHNSPVERGVLLRELGNRLTIRDSATSWTALVRKLKPVFAWNHCDMLWIQNDSDGQPQFVLDEAYVYQPTNQPRQWVVLREHPGETDDAYRQVMGNNLRGVAHLCLSVPAPDNDAGEIGDYAVVLSQNPGLGTVYEVGWRQLMSAGTGHGVNNRRIYLYHHSANDWHFLGEGIGVGNGKSGCCESLSTDVKARVVWLTNHNRGIPLEIKLQIRREDVQWDEAGKSRADISIDEAVLAGKFPAECRESQLNSSNKTARGTDGSAEELALDVRGGYCDDTIFSMMDRRVGWARGTNAVFKTVNGGDSWQKVLSDEPRQPMASFFYDSKRAWVVSGVADDATNATVFRTTDGGRSWTGCEVRQRDPIMFCFVSFSDVNNGWLMLIPDHGMNSSPGNLYRTEDGGRSWREVNHASTTYNWDSYTKVAFESTLPNLTCGGPVSFRNANGGWLTGSLASTSPGYLFVTEDRGANWRGQTLSLPSSLQNGRIEPGLPRFFQGNSEKGIIVADFVPEDSYATNFATVVYGTADGGLTWHPTTPIKSSSRTCSFITAKEGWVWSDGQGGMLYHTEDGGVSWSPAEARKSLTELLNHREGVAQLDFIDKQFGWAVAIDNSLRTQFFRTTDAGKTWRTIHPTVQH